MKEQTATYALKLAKCAHAASCAKRAACCCHLLLLPFLDSSGRCLARFLLRCCGSLQISNYLGQYQTISRTQKCRVWCCTYASALAYLGAHPARTAPPNTAPHLLTTPALSISLPVPRALLTESPERLVLHTHSQSLTHARDSLCTMGAVRRAAGASTTAQGGAWRGVLAAWAGRALVHCMERREAVVSTGREHGS